MSADPNQLHVFTVVSQIGHVMHNIVGQEDDFDDVNVFQQNASDVPMQVIDATGAGGSLAVCALASQGGKLYFTTSTDPYTYGKWVGFFDVAQYSKNGPGSFKDVGCVGGDQIYICGCGTDGQLYLTTVNGGSFKPFFTNVNDNNSGGGSDPQPGLFTNVACAFDNDAGRLYIFAVDAGYASWFTYLDSDGTWQGSFTPLNSLISIGQSKDIACAVVDGTLHVCTVNQVSGYIAHCYQQTEGEWVGQAVPSFDDKTYGRFWNVACTNVNNTLILCGITTKTHLWATGGTWQTWTDISLDETNNYGTIGAAGVYITPSLFLIIESEPT